MKKFYGLPYKDYRKMVRGGNLLIKVNKNTGNLEHINRATGKTLFVDKNYVAPQDDNVRPPPGTEVKPPKKFIAKPPPKVAPVAPKQEETTSGLGRGDTGGRGGGRMSSDFDPNSRPGYKWNSRNYTWEKLPNYEGGPTEGKATEGFGLMSVKRKPKEEKGVLMTDKSTSSNLRIKKRGGKRRFRVKGPFVGGMRKSGNVTSNIGLS